MAEILPSDALPDLDDLLQQALTSRRPAEGKSAETTSAFVAVQRRPIPKPAPFNAYPGTVKEPQQKFLTVAALAVFVQSRCKCGETATTFSHYAFKQRTTLPPHGHRVVKADQAGVSRGNLPAESLILTTEVPLCASCASGQGWDLGVAVEKQIGGGVVSAYARLASSIPPVPGAAEVDTTVHSPLPESPNAAP